MAQQKDMVEQDEWVRSETSLGMARFIAQGSEPNDVADTLARIKGNEDWIREWSASAAVHEELAREAEQKGHPFSAGEAYIRASLGYHWGKMRWIGVLDHEDQYQQAHRKSIETFQKGLQILDPATERVEINYEGITMPAYLRRPPGIVRPPVVVLVPGYDSVKEEFFHWANVFLNRGLAILSPDGPGQGETRNKMPIRHDYEGAGSAMIDFLEQQGDLDASSIGVVGISLGGYYAPRIACFEHRIKTAVSVSGSFRGRISPEGVGPWALFAHGATSSGEVVEKTSRRTLEGIIGNIRCPYLVVNGKLDAQSTYTNTEELAREAEAAGVKVTYVLYEEGSHVCFNIPHKCRPLVGDWMADHLKAT